VDTVYMHSPLEQIVICNAITDPLKRVPDGRYLTPDEASELGELHELYEPMRNLIGTGLDHVIAVPGALRLFLATLGETVTPPTLGEIYGPFLTTEAELVANLESAKPMRYNSATKCPDHAEVLKARAYSTCRVAFVGAARYVELHALDRALFTGGPDTAKLRLPGRFSIVGLRRDDDAGHCLLVGANETRVRLPKDDPRFDWQAVHAVLEVRHDLIGDIVRASKADEWTPATEGHIAPTPGLPLA
jgi:hypothetical protein